jgi:hypothetical protein
MATFNFNSAVLPEGTTFIFDSWVCVVDGASDFYRHLIDNMKPEAPQQPNAANSTSSSINLTRCCSLASLGISRRSLFFTRLRPVLHQASSNRIQFSPRDSIPDSHSGCTTRPLYIRRPYNPSSSLHRRRTWMAYSRSEKSGPPHVGRPRSSMTTTRTLMTTWSLLWAIIRVW